MLSRVNVDNVDGFSTRSSYLVRVYDGASRPSPRLLDMIEFLCIYTHDSLSQDIEITGDLVSSFFDGCGLDRSSFCETGFADASHPPPSVAPRLHSVSWRKLGSSFPLLMTVDSVPSKSSLATIALQTVLNKSAPRVDTNSYHILSESYFGLLDSVEADVMLSRDRLIEVRSSVLALLTDALWGDSLAAEYVLLGVLSQVYSRHEESLLGSVTVQLIGIQAGDERVKSLERGLANFVPRIVKVLFKFYFE